jgi:hypothetical protein
MIGVDLHCCIEHVGEPVEGVVVSLLPPTREAYSKLRIREGELAWAAISSICIPK